MTYRKEKSMTCPETVEFSIDEITEDWPDGSQDHGYMITIKVEEDDGPKQYTFGGDEFSDIACDTADEAIAIVKKWCVDRGYHEPLAMFTITARRVQ